MEEHLEWLDGGGRVDHLAGADYIRQSTFTHHKSESTGCLVRHLESANSAVFLPSLALAVSPLSTRK